MKLLPIDVTFPNDTENVICDICPKVKQQRLPFHLSVISTFAAFELIHVDTWGPYHTKTYTGQKFFLTIVDDYNMSTWLYLLKHKSWALDTLQNFMNLITNQFQAKVNIIKSDNALEFDNGPC